MIFSAIYYTVYLIDAVRSSGILKVKQKLGVTFNFDKQDVIDFMKFSKMTMHDCAGPEKLIYKSSIIKFGET